jgi:hypothetical protein
MNLAFGLYAAECEGVLDTKEGKIQKAIKLLKKVKGEIPDEVLLDVCEDCGLEISSLSQSEFNRIKRAIRN